MAGNLSQHYEKVVLGLALVIALALGGIVYLNAGKAEKDFPGATTVRYGLPEMGLEDEFRTKAGQVEAPIALPPPVLENGRTVSLFTGIPWFLKRDSAEPVDLGDKSNPPVHGDIPNSYWLEHRIPPGFADSPERDHDSDGFSNREEFEAKTDPTDFDSRPSLIAKLECAVLAKKPFLLEYTGDTAPGDLTPETTYRFRYTGIVQGQRRTINSDYIKAGQGAASTFFTEGPAQLRFELKSVERREVRNARTGLVEMINFAQVEDLSPTKKGDIHEIQKGSRNGKIITDYTATLFLNAIGEKENKVEVPERARFALPLDPNAPDAKKTYLFKEVTQDDEVVIEWQEGNETKRRIILPQSVPK